MNCKVCNSDDCDKHFYCEHCACFVEHEIVAVCFAVVRTRRGVERAEWTYWGRDENDRYGYVPRQKLVPCTRCPNCFKESWQAGAFVQRELLNSLSPWYRPNKLRTTSSTYRRLIVAAGLKPSKSIKLRPIPKHDKGLTIRMDPVPPDVLDEVSKLSYAYSPDTTYHPLNRWARFATHSKILEQPKSRWAR